MEQRYCAQTKDQTSDNINITSSILKPFWFARIIRVSTLQINTLRGKQVPEPTKKGCLGEKSYLHQLLKLDARCSGLKLKANNSSHLELQYCCVGFLHYTKYCCSNWLVKMADIFFCKYTQDFVSSNLHGQRDKSETILGRICAHASHKIDLHSFWVATQNEGQCTTSKKLNK